MIGCQKCRGIERFDLCPEHWEEEKKKDQIEFNWFQMRYRYIFANWPLHEVWAGLDKYNEDRTKKMLEIGRLI